MRNTTMMRAADGLTAEAVCEPQPHRHTTPNPPTSRHSNLSRGPLMRSLAAYKTLTDPSRLPATDDWVYRVGNFPAWKRDFYTHLCAVAANFVEEMLFTYDSARLRYLRQHYRIFTVNRSRELDMECKRREVRYGYW